MSIYPIGISDGRSGYKSFLSSFPIKIKFNNLSKGEIHILKNNNVINKSTLDVLNQTVSTAVTKIIMELRGS